MNFTHGFRMMRNTFFFFSLIAIFVSSLTQQIAEASIQGDPIGHADNQMKVLVLVIACDQNSPYYGVTKHPVYVKLQTMWRSYMGLDPQHVEVYFLKANPHLTNDFEIQGDTIWWKGEETWIPGILNKTLIAMEAMLPRLDEFQYVLRTNLSSFFIFPRLLNYLETLPKEKCYCGIKDYYGGFPFVQGARIILSTDLVRLLVDNKQHLMNHSMIDDPAIGLFFLHQNIHLLDHVPPRLDIKSLMMWETQKNHIPENIFHTTTPNETRKRDPDEIILQSELIKRFYGIDISPP